MPYNYFICYISYAFLVILTLFLLSAVLVIALISFEIYLVEPNWNENLGCKIEQRDHYTTASDISAH